jgi:hypothetical protein
MRCRFGFLLIVVFAIALGSAATAQTNSKFPAANTIDVLQWMVMQAADKNGSPLASHFHMTGNANPLFTSMQTDRFFWTKTGSGYPWDVQLYDDNYIYLWVTELNWQDPTTYKVFRGRQSGNFNLPLAPRFVTLGDTSGKLASIEITDSSYEIHTSCTNYTIKNLGNVINEVWGPYSETFGGDLPANLRTIVLSYRYSCDAFYSNCGDKEEFHLAYPFGLVHWQHQKWNGTGYNPPDNQTTFNHVSTGTVNPAISCGENFDGH